MIELCPIFANYSYSFDSPVNKEFANALDGWSVVAKDKLLIYTYFTNYTHNFANINNFGTVASMLNDYKSKGVSYVITQGASDSNVPCFDEMRSYVESNLMWDLNQNYETLAKDFMDHYYKEASDSMFKVYEMIRDRYTWFQAAVSVSSGSLTGDIYDNRLYTVQFINQLDKQIDLALASIDDLKENDTEKYTTLKNPYTERRIARNISENETLPRLLRGRRKRRNERSMGILYKLLRYNQRQRRKRLADFV